MPESELVSYPPGPAVPSGPVASAQRVSGELLAYVVAELPSLTVLGDRDRMLAAAWLASLRSARTRRSYAGDFLTWQSWTGERDIDVLGAGRVQLDLWVSTQLATGAGDATVRRRLSGVGSFYRYLLTHDLIAANPVTGVARPKVDPDYTTTIGLTREQARALIVAADRDPGPARLRTAAAIRLLLHNALRVDEVLGADITDLGVDRGHQTLTILGKGNRRARVPLSPSTMAALHDYLDYRANTTGHPDRQHLVGPLLATRTGGRMRQFQLWELVRRLAATAEITEWARLSPHSLRHTAITVALDAGVPLRDVQDYARHRDARTTRRYDHSRDNLDRSAVYTVAAQLA